MRIFRRLTGIILLIAGILIIQVNAQHVDLTLQDTIISTNAWFEATNSITASTGFTITSSGDVTFRSGNYIVLNPGFTLMTGGLFNAFPGAALGVEDDNTIIPNALTVLQNYPNPFSHNTEICYGLPKSDYITIVVYNFSGGKIKTLVAQKQQAGYHVIVWDGTDENGTEVSGGIYSCLVKTSQYAITRKMILMK